MYLIFESGWLTTTRRIHEASSRKIADDQILGKVDEALNDGGTVASPIAATQPDIQAGRQDR